MKKSKIQIRNFLMTAALFLSGAAGLAETGANDNAWLFLCRLQDTGQKIQFLIPADVESKVLPEVIITDGATGEERFLVQARIPLPEFEIAQSPQGVRYVARLKASLGKSGTITVVAGEVLDDSYGLVSSEAIVRSNLMRFNFPEGVQAESCMTFFSTGPKPISTGGN